MRLMVIGASGFLGRHVWHQARAAGMEVVTAGRSPLPGSPRHRPADLAGEDPARIASMLAEVAPGAVVNCAGTTSGAPGTLAVANVNGTYTLVTAMLQAGLPARLVHLGSAAEYGATEPGVPITEGTRPRPVKLLDGGRVAGRLTDRAHGARPPSNGHARRAGPGDLPLPRGANVVVASGHATTDEMARRLSSGLWIEELDGGSIELASGRFRLKFPRARRVRRGRLADECGPGLLAGDVLSALKAIDGGLGHDVHVYRALGFCARSGQVVPVQGASPDVLVRRLAVRSLS